MGCPHSQLICTGESMGHSRGTEKGPSGCTGRTPHQWGKGDRQRLTERAGGVGAELSSLPAALALLTNPILPSSTSLPCQGVLIGGFLPSISHVHLKYTFTQGPQGGVRRPVGSSRPTASAVKERGAERAQIPRVALRAQACANALPKELQSKEGWQGLSCSH